MILSTKYTDITNSIICVEFLVEKLLPSEEMNTATWVQIIDRTVYILHSEFNYFPSSYGKNHHHHHDVRLARISLTLSLHVSLSFIALGRSSGLHPESSHSCCMNVRAGRPAFDWPYAGVHRSTSLTISSLLLQQCSASSSKWILYPWYESWFRRRKTQISNLLNST